MASMILILSFSDKFFTSLVKSKIWFEFSSIDLAFLIV